MSMHHPDPADGAPRSAGPTAPHSPDPTARDDVAFVVALAEILARHDLYEIAVERKWTSGDSIAVRLARFAPAPAPAPAAAAATVAGGGALAGPSAAPGTALPDDPAQHPGAVTSPMVGTAYLAPEPGATPFVALGQSVTEGQTLLIIEAMKTMNQIPSPRAGTVRRVLIEDGTPVEYGAPLMIVE